MGRVPHWQLGREGRHGLSRHKRHPFIFSTAVIREAGERVGQRPDGEGEEGDGLFRHPVHRAASPCASESLRPYSSVYFEQCEEGRMLGARRRMLLLVRQGITVTWRHDCQCVCISSACNSSASLSTPPTRDTLRRNTIISYYSIRFSYYKVMGASRAGGNGKGGHTVPHETCIQRHTPPYMHII